MATKFHNLSQYDAEQMPNANVLARQRFAIIVADWNSEITYPLLEGAYETLVKHGVKENHIKVTHVPGTVELTYAAAQCQRYYPKRRFYDAVIVIGCVIKGDTPHFDYVCQSVTQGVTTLNVNGLTPVIFSVLTTLDRQQALDRAGGKLGNKGVEGAYTAIRMANLVAGNED
ncbi:MAG: 6,7-dimethyl-8-ribityllumazine synthase [Paludibacter sp.]|nr:6,7-dimethyl-8-ribityllumazine synthase [Bacteroidales bacterium]MCM1068795.1 6,7-dimethyl-8-ribityllumazine synthase [Prevotella sp.]MCM1353936.1 6,7-dimethyl-8-ribityllumazine synthase [Bacteroides sp.]MCM1443334.1 6,7-dimethyl-8-ribityllumazine synthase [Muribaculum sp.]MCM1482125.1 6,7-dimethyl-8-ribityllumazine synthase [Paludibacter sp.]